MKQLLRQLQTHFIIIVPVLALFIFIPIQLLSTGCTSGKKYPYEVYTANGSGWDLSRSIIHCDSVKLYNPKHGVIYRDGVATEVYAERILISTN